MISEAVIKAGIAGDRNAYQTIYKELAGKLFPICLRYASSREEASDWCQDAFIKLFIKLKMFDGKQSAFETWAHNLFKNHCIDQYRKSRIKHKVKIEYVDELPDSPIDDTDVDDEKDFEEFQKLKAEQLIGLIQNALNQKERTVFNMIAIDGYSYAEVVTELQIPLGTVKATYHWGKKKLRNLVCKH